MSKMDTLATSEKRPHVIFIPFPAQSHVKAMLKFAEYLHHKGLHITFVNTESIHKRLLDSGGLDSSPGFRFETIVDGNSSDGILDFYLTPFLDLAVKLPNTPTCIISDGFMSDFTIDAAKELGLPIMLYWTFSACGFMGVYQVQSLIDKGLVPLKDESYLTNGYLDTIIDWIPGMEGIRLKDMNGIIRTTNLEDQVFTFCIRAAAKSHSVIHNIFQTFDSLETNIVNALYCMIPQVYTVGPLQLHLEQIPDQNEKMSDFNIGYSLWKEESECLQWLESKEPNSVIYVNYGSFINMSSQDLTEFGWGIVHSNYSFLWIIRPDLVVGETAALPTEFEKYIEEKKGFIASWCPQEKVLNHPSVGGFLTHCGWGSTIESLSAGVPMICWPYSWDQLTNCRYICNEWEVGLEMGNAVKREEVTKLVQELMGGNNKMRNKAIEWKEKARTATRPNGSSSLNMNKLIEEIIMLSDKNVTNSSHVKSG